MKKILTAAMMTLAVSCSLGNGEIKKISAGDIVLLYAGGQKGNFYNQDYLSDYVSYTDRDGQMRWLFDGFLLLQIRDFGPNSSQVAFDPGHKDEDGTVLQAANQADWMKLIDYYFSDGHCMDALDKEVARVAETIGKPPYKRQVIISIPNPIPYKQPLSKKGGTTWWGILNDRVTDFSREEDRAAACEWFVDKVLERYAARHYGNVELAGFYWITEETEASGTLLQKVSAHVHSKGYPMTWIPYFEAPGYTLWREKGFDMAWYQPNYFFRSDVAADRLETACRQALENGMAMEVEFDERVCATPSWGDGTSLGYRLRDYMAAFRKYGSWENCRMAYYQGTEAVRALKRSPDPQDRELYQDFCDFVSKRPYRQGMEKH